MTHQYDADVVALVVEQLDVDEQTIVLIAYASRMLPIADLRGRFRALGLLTEGSTLNGLGRAVGLEILRRDPDARDPRQACS